MVGEKSAGTIQVDDNQELLDLMLDDYLGASGKYHATARWLGYSEKLVDFLKQEGLRDFRRNKSEPGSPGHVLASFGAVDLNPEGTVNEDLYHAAATCLIKNDAAKIEMLESSRVGNPEGFYIDGRFYTLSWLNFYCRYSYVSRFFSFDDKVVVELGSGSGKQAEMLKRAHPNITIILFDLPTQLYVCHQYLSKVFEGEDKIVPYETTRNFSSFSDVVKGKINILPNWKFPILEGVEVDLFWNAASLQEMGPETASQYLEYAKGAKNQYLMYNIKYKTTPKYYTFRGVIGGENMLHLDELDRSVAKMAYNTNNIYFDSFWTKTLPSDNPKPRSMISRLLMPRD